MHRHDHFLQRVAASTRKAPLPGDLEPPNGFVTRVVAGLKREPAVFAGEGWVWSATGLAAAVCLACAGWEWSAPRPDEDAAFVAQCSNLPFQP